MLHRPFLHTLFALRRTLRTSGQLFCKISVYTLLSSSFAGELLSSDFYLYMCTVHRLLLRVSGVFVDNLFISCLERVKISAIELDLLQFEENRIVKKIAVQKRNFFRQKVKRKALGDFFLNLNGPRWG